MTNTTNAGAQRLDSWKAIADYLSRDVATVRRWEKSLRLPVRRVGGVSRGRSVFAYRNEIDEWLKAQDLSTPSDPPPVARSRGWRFKLAGITLAAGLAMVAWHGRSPSADAGLTTVEVTPSGVVAHGPGGIERWRHAFPADHRTFLLPWHAGVHPLVEGGAGGVIAGTSYSHDTVSGSDTGGTLLRLSATGQLERAFSFNDRLAFNEETYGPPWALTDYRLSDASGDGSIAIAAHHMHWWPSVVTILDRRWERTATFVHAGWIERLLWVSRDRLVVAGFSNARDGGMVALLDTTAMNGQSPRVADSRYTCPSCGPESPRRYVVLPRSELNRVTGSPFNRAQLEPSGGRIVLRTIEVPKEASPADALYEFSASLDLLSASYGDRYWELHRSLEAQGKLDHPQARCPEREGPRAIDVWQPDTGWKTIPVKP